jgi:hypothetical protein
VCNGPGAECRDEPLFKYIPRNCDAPFFDRERRAFHGLLRHIGDCNYSPGEGVALILQHDKAALIEPHARTIGERPCQPAKRAQAAHHFRFQMAIAIVGDKPSLSAAIHPNDDVRSAWV